MSDDLQVKPGITIPVAELFFSASRSGGPGGQHANKTSSRVTLSWSPESSSALSQVQKNRVRKCLEFRLTQEGNLQIHVEDSRSQHKNKQVAKERLKQLLVEALKVPKHRTKTKPSKAAKRRRVDAKKTRGDLKKLRQKPADD